MESSLFDWSSWRAGNVRDLGLYCRGGGLLSGKRILRDHAIGWCEGEKVPCRPKRGEIAVMFVKGEREFWFHMREGEFREVFGEE